MRENKRKFLTACKRILCCVLCVALALSMMGCRPSDILEKIRYTSNADEVDETQEDFNPSTDGRIDDFISTLQVQEAEDIRDEEQVGQIDDASNNQELTAETTYSQLGFNIRTSETGSTSTSPNGTTTNDEKSDTLGEDSDLKKDTVSSGGSSSGSGNSEGSSGEDDSDSPSSDDTGDVTYTPVMRPDSSARTYKKVTDLSGQQVSIPKNVRRVTAVGAAAQIVEIVGGSGRLAASNADFLNNSLAQTVVSDISNIQEWWSGDGSNAIGETQLQQLLADDTIDVVFEISGQNTFTDMQVERMVSYNVVYIPLLPLSSIENLKKDVELVGAVMNSAYYDTDSVARATSYNNWVDNLLSDVSNRTASYSRATTYIAGWDYNVGYTLLHLGDFFTPSNTDEAFGTVNGSGTGLAYTYTSAAKVMLNAMSSNAHVSSTSTKNDSFLGHTAKTTYVYVAPVFHLYNVTGGGALNLTNYSYDYPDGSAMVGYSRYLYYQVGASVVPLGKSDFPAIIVANNQIKSQIQSNSFWNYSGTGGPCVNNSTYQIYVNPSGIGDWAAGSVESPLESLWIAHVICGQYSDTEMRSKVSDFYYQFFGAILSNDQVDAILNP